MGRGLGAVGRLQVETGVALPNHRRILAESGVFLRSLMHPIESGKHLPVFALPRVRLARMPLQPRHRKGDLVCPTNRESSCDKNYTML
jgi:hypothetical protein